MLGIRPAGLGGRQSVDRRRAAGRAIPVAGPNTYLELLERLPLDVIVIVRQSDDTDLIESRPDRPPVFVRCGLFMPNNWHGKRTPCWLTHLYCFQALVRLRRTWGHVPFPVPINFNPVLKARAAELACQLEARYSRHRAERGKRLLFSVIPWEAAIVPHRTSRYRQRVVNPRRYVSMPEDVDLYPHFLRHPDPESLFQSDNHLSAAGARLVAGHLAQAVLDVGESIATALSVASLKTVED